MNLGHVLTSIQNIVRSIGRYFFMHNKMIYFVLFVGVLIGALLGLNIALNQPTDEAYRTQKLNESQSARFDTATIQKIQALNSKQQTNTDTLPAGQRTNPFGE